MTAPQRAGEEGGPPQVCRVGETAPVFPHATAGGFVDYLRKVAGGGLSLLRGLGVTLGYFTHPGRIVTEQYPENRATLTMHPRFRGEVTMVRDDDGGHYCTACLICEKTCPNATLSVITSRDEAGKRVLEKYLYRIGQCTLCGLCVESCPFGAITMGQGFEHAATGKEGFERDLFRKERCP